VTVVTIEMYLCRQEVSCSNLLMAKHNGMSQRQLSLQTEELQLTCLSVCLSVSAAVDSGNRLKPELTVSGVKVLVSSIIHSLVRFFLSFSWSAVRNAITILLLLTNYTQQTLS
jgi:hypothetical protein